MRVRVAALPAAAAGVSGGEEEWDSPLASLHTAAAGAAATIGGVEGFAESFKVLPKQRTAAGGGAGGARTVWSSFRAPRVVVVLSGADGYGREADREADSGEKRSTRARTPKRLRVMVGRSKGPVVGRSEKWMK